MRERCPTAGINLMIAQHRDALRYARLRSGAYLPKLRRFVTGDHVYIKRPDKVGLTSGPFELKALPYVLRVREVRDGVLRLEGRDGHVISENVRNCIPCQLPIADGVIDWSSWRPTFDHPCAVCGYPDEADSMLVCDACYSTWHMACLQPPLSEVPAGTWLCPRCQGAEPSQQAVMAPVHESCYVALRG